MSKRNTWCVPLNTANKLLESGILDGAMVTRSLKMVMVEARLCEEGRRAQTKDEKEEQHRKMRMGGNMQRGNSSLRQHSVIGQVANCMQLIGLFLSIISGGCTAPCSLTLPILQ